MKKILVIAALLGVMFALDALRIDSASTTNPVTLAAIGFVVLAAFASAELGSALGLPRVTGYILAGVALGPSLGNILSGQVVTDMRMFNTLALGLIATSAGLELDVRQLLRLGKTLTATILVKTVLGVGLVGGTMLVLARLFDLGIPEGARAPATLALALIMGVLSIGTSPSITLAVLSETRAKGRLADLVLGAAVFKDLVVVVCLAIAVAVARSLLVPGSALDSAVLIAVGKELGGSLLAGTLLGGVLIAYMRFIKAEMLLFVAAMILVVAELCRALHLELLLVFIMAGFIVRNLSKYEHELMKPLELVALPVFVVFFTNAGAGIDLQGTWRILPLALALCAARAVVYYVSARFGASVGKESPAVAQNAWYAYLPQAGVTLGLVGLAAQQLPVIGSSIATTGMAVVAINLLIGPVVLRKALAAAREIPGEEGTAPESAGSVAPPSSSATRTPLHVSGIQSQRVATDPKLSKHFTQLKARTLSTLDEFQTSTLRSLPRLPRTTAEPRLEDFERFVAAHRKACRALFDDLVGSLAGLPPVIHASLELPTLDSRGSDKWPMRVQLWFRRVSFRLFARSRRRTVLVRLGARMTLERGFAELAYAVFERSIFQHLSEFERRSSGKPSDDSDDEWLRQQLATLVDAHFEEFADLLQRMGTPRCRAAQLRFSNVEPLIRSAVASLEAGQEDFWARRAQAVWGSGLAHAHALDLERSVTRAIEQNVLSPARAAEKRLGPALQRLTQALESLRDQCTENASGGAAPTIVAWRSEVDAVRHEALDELSRDLRASTAMRALGNELRQAMTALPPEVRCLQLDQEQSARNGAIRRVELRALAERYWIKGLVPGVDQATRTISNAFAQLPRRVKEALDPSWSLLEALAEQATRADFTQRAREELTLAVHRINLVEQRMQRQLESNTQSIQHAFEHARKALLDHIELQGTDATTRQRLIERLFERIGSKIVAVLDWLKRHGPNTAALRDATDLRQAVERWHGERLPPAVARWFSQAPVRDERIFTAQRDLLEAIVDEEARWIAGRRSAVLVRGGVGSGKSSTLNMCELELRSTRVVKLDGEGSEQAGSCFEALSLVLGCSADEGTLVRHLALYRPAVLVDNLDSWLSRSRERTAELDRLLSLITQTRDIAFWVMAVDAASLEVFEEISNVTEVFTRVLDCRPLSTVELSELLEARRQRAGIEMVFGRTLVGEFLHRSGVGGEKELFLRTLTHVSNGNPGRALAECMRAASMKDGSLLLSTAILRSGRTRIAQSLTTAQLAVLATLVKHGSGDVSRLVIELGLQRDQLQRNLSFLLGAGLLSIAAEGQSYEVTEEARWPVVLELQRLGALGRAKA